MVILAELADHGGGLVDGTSDEVGIFSMCCVPVASIKYPYSLAVACGQALEVPDEAVFIVDL